MVTAWAGLREKYWLLESPTRTLLAAPGSHWTTTAEQGWLPRLPGVVVAVTWPALGLSPVERDISSPWFRGRRVRAWLPRGTSTASADAGPGSGARPAGRPS